MGKRKTRGHGGNDQERGSAVQAEEQREGAKSSSIQEQMKSTAEQVSRKHQRRFGHN